MIFQDNDLNIAKMAASMFANPKTELWDELHSSILCMYATIYDDKNDMDGCERSRFLLSVGCNVCHNYFRSNKRRTAATERMRRSPPSVSSLFDTEKALTQLPRDIQRTIDMMSKTSVTRYKMSQVKEAIRRHCE